MKQYNKPRKSYVLFCLGLEPLTMIRLLQRSLSSQSLGK